MCNNDLCKTALARCFSDLEQEKSTKSEYSWEVIINQNMQKDFMILSLSL